MAYTAAFPLFLVAALAGQAHASKPSALQPLLEDAVQAAVVVAEATSSVILNSVRLPQGCLPEQAQVDRPLSTSGQLSVKVRGTTRKGTVCEGWANATVTLVAPVMVTTRVVRTGEPLDAATTVQWRELGRGPQPAAAKSGGVAARTLMSGQVVDVSSVRSSKLSSGSQVRVTVRMGSLSVEQVGRLVPCGNDQTCAVLPSGRRVEGSLEDDRLVVMVP